MASGMARFPFVSGPLRSAALLALVFAVFAGLSSLARAQDEQPIEFFRIGTGSTDGNYFPMGGILASAISNPPGSRPCDRGGACGVAGLIAVAQSTAGSVANVEAIEAGQMESGFSQADIAYWAYNGTKAFAKKEAHRSLRVIARLYPESVHVVVRRDAGIFRIEDLKGKRISIDREGSGTRVDALLILKAYGLGPGNVDLIDVPAGEAGDLLRAGELDGFFFVAGASAPALIQLSEESLITLLPITGKQAEKLRKAYPFFTESRISAGTYFNVPSTETLGVGALWLVSAHMPNDLVYEVTKTIYLESVQRFLADGHKLGELISLRTALDGVREPPLHPGAARFYQENGFISWVQSTN